jgi:hypothetical protein
LTLVTETADLLRTLQALLSEPQQQKIQTDQQMARLRLAEARAVIEDAVRRYPFNRSDLGLLPAWRDWTHPITISDVKFEPGFRDVFVYRVAGSIDVSAVVDVTVSYHMPVSHDAAPPGHLAGTNRIAMQLEALADSHGNVQVSPLTGIRVKAVARVP